MSIVNIRNIEIVNNPAKFSDPYVFRIQFECIAPLKEDLEWKLIYVGAADSEKYDQELDSCMVGPIPVGLNSFEFSAAAPNLSLLPSATPNSGPPSPADLIGVTVIILSALYNDKEFVRVGYYVAANWESEEYAADVEEGKREGSMDGLVRNVKVDTPRVTRFSNKWDAPESSVPSTESTSNSFLPSSAPQNPSTNPQPARDPLESPLPPAITAVPAPASALASASDAPSTSTAPTVADAEPVAAEGAEKEELARPLAAAAEETDKMGAETAGDMGRGEEAGEGLASQAGGELSQI